LVRGDRGEGAVALQSAGPLVGDEVEGGAEASDGVIKGTGLVFLSAEITAIHVT
jgi:hypothetical protein